MKHFTPLALFLLTACGSMPAKHPVAVQPVAATSGSAIIEITRDSGIVAVGCTMEIYLDGTIIAHLDTSERTQFQTSPGEHVLEVKSGCGNAETGVDIVAVDGQTKKYRLAVGLDGTVSLLRTTT